MNQLQTTTKDAEFNYKDVTGQPRKPSAAVAAAAAAAASVAAVHPIQEPEEQERQEESFYQEQTESYASSYEGTWLRVPSKQDWKHVHHGLLNCFIQHFVEITSRSQELGFNT